MIFRFIAAKWAEESGAIKRIHRSFERDCDFDDIHKWNKQGYNCYYFPNHPSDYSLIPMNEKGTRKRFIRAGDIDVFNYCFVDLDMKDYMSDQEDRRHEYKTKEEFIERLQSEEPKPTVIVDTGGGIHAYWKVNNLDAMSFLRLNRRLCRLLHSDPAVSTLNQLMRVPGTLNTKLEGNYRPCEVLIENADIQYDVEAFSKMLPPITPDDEEYCREHYEKAYNFDEAAIKVTEELPTSFLRLCRLNPKIKELFYGESNDRSTTDFRLAHLLHLNGISQEDAMSVLFNTEKASERTRVHRYNYAANMVRKIWIEAEAEKPKPNELTPRTITEILGDSDDDSTKTRFPCHPMIDGTTYGFRLSHVCGLVGGSGNGKTTVGLNMFSWFTEYNINTDYIHLYFSGEMPEDEIADIWKPMAVELANERKRRNQSPVDWNSKVYVLGNHNKDGSFRELGLDQIRDYIFQLEKMTGKKVGCVVLDHIGILKQNKGTGEFDGLIGNCKRLKSFAVETNTFVVVQSQTSRAKNGGGDTELDMDAAFGTSQFENYCDWIITTWQPLKRVLDDAPHMTVQAFKVCKIRRKNVLTDRIKADVPYGMMFDPRTGRLRELTTDEEKVFDYWNKKATKIRNRDRKRDSTPIRVVTWTGVNKSETEGTDDASTA